MIDARIVSHETEFISSLKRSRRAIIKTDAHGAQCAMGISFLSGHKRPVCGFFAGTCSKHLRCLEHVPHVVARLRIVNEMRRSSARNGYIR